MKCDPLRKSDVESLLCTGQFSSRPFSGPKEVPVIKSNNFCDKKNIGKKIGLFRDKIFNLRKRSAHDLKKNAKFRNSSLSKYPLLSESSA